MGDLPVISAIYSAVYVLPTPDGPWSKKIWPSPLLCTKSADHAPSLRSAAVYLCESVVVIRFLRSGILSLSIAFWFASKISKQLMSKTSRTSLVDVKPVYMKEAMTYPILGFSGRTLALPLEIRRNGPQSDAWLEFEFIAILFVLVLGPWINVLKVGPRFSAFRR